MKRKSKKIIFLSKIPGKDNKKEIVADAPRKKRNFFNLCKP